MENTKAFNKGEKEFEKTRHKEAKKRIGLEGRNKQRTDGIRNNKRDVNDKRMQAEGRAADKDDK